MARKNEGRMKNAEWGKRRKDNGCRMKNQNDKYRMEKGWENDER
jgi:hypothetical protein